MKKRKRTKKKTGSKGFSEGAELLPAASLGSRTSRPATVGPGTEAGYYLDLADIALGRKPSPHAERKGRGNP
ncbi:MAG: hypothetical protein ACM3PW_18855 [Chlamydiota bacterium]